MHKKEFLLTGEAPQEGSRGTTERQYLAGKSYPNKGRELPI
jgi:hypothetical protein